MKTTQARAVELLELVARGEATAEWVAEQLAVDVLERTRVALDLYDRVVIDAHSCMLIIRGDA